MYYYLFPYLYRVFFNFSSATMNKNEVISIGYRLHCKANHRITPEKGGCRTPHEPRLRPQPLLHAGHFQRPGPAQHDRISGHLRLS